tara:strand:- start:1169 stop:1483 length:315 start_codon:yes stop_codon:yes gene_type:complete
MNQTLFNIGGCELAPCEVRMFTDILDSPDHVYAPEDKPDDLTRQTLDILVLEGLIERFQGPDGAWLDAWGITDGAINWLVDPEVQADIELAKGLNRLSFLLTSS